MLLLIAGFVLFEAAHRLINPIIPEITYASLIALVATLVVNLCVCIYEYRQGKKLDSAILISDSLHTRSDVYISISVLTTLLAIKYGLPPIIDPLASLVVVGFILKAAIQIIRSTSEVLVDSAVADSDKIRDITLSFQEVHGVHDIRSRGSEQELYIDMHVLIDPEMEIAESHRLCHAVEEKICRELQVGARVMIHMDPFAVPTWDTGVISLTNLCRVVMLFILFQWFIQSIKCNQLRPKQSLDEVNSESAVFIVNESNLSVGLFHFDRE